MNIIEKLGITPGPWEKDYGGTEHHIKSVHHKDKWTPTVCRYNDDFKDGGRLIVADSLTEDERQANGILIAAAPEMLEALVEISDKIISANYTVCLDRTSDNIKIIEKATGKTWEEIKELLNDI